MHTSKFHLPRLHPHGHDRGHDGQALPKGVLSEEEIKAVARQVLEGLQYLHARGYIHVSIDMLIISTSIPAYPPSW